MGEYENIVWISAVSGLIRGSVPRIKAPDGGVEEKQDINPAQFQLKKKSCSTSDLHAALGYIAILTTI